MKDGIAQPQRLVSLQHVNDLKGISYRPEAGLRVGAGVTLDELMESAEVRQHYPALAQAAEGVRSPQIRSTGTVGGDLCQRPRCWYYRAGFGLLAVYKGKALVPGRRQSLPRHPGECRAGLFRQPLQPGAHSDRS